MYFHSTCQFYKYKSTLIDGYKINRHTYNLTTNKLDIEINITYTIFVIIYITYKVGKPKQKENIKY